MLNKRILQSIGSSESTTVEWKQSLGEISEIIQAIVAFTNTEGGKVFVGVANSGKILGVQIGKGTIENLANQIALHTDPKVQPRIVVQKIDGKEIIIIEVSRSLDGLVLADGRPYKRVGKSSPKMSKDEYERLVLDKHKDKTQFDEAICRSATLKDIQVSKVRWFLEKAKEEKRLDVPTGVSIKEALIRLKLLRGGKLTNAAILLFGKKPQDFFIQAKIRVARFKGVDGHDYLDMKVLEGTIPELRQSALKYIAEYTRHAVFFDANQRFDKWEYPDRALEEILNNALAHRDYQASSDIHLAIYDNRIEIWNPGKLPRSLTLAQLKRKHTSIPRNRFLAERLFFIKYIEHWGRGTNRIVEAMREDKLPDPIFEEYSGGLSVTLWGPGKSFEKVIDDIKLHKLDLNERQKKAMNFIKDHGDISRKQYVDLVSGSVRQANKDLSDMLTKKILVPMGAGRSTKYKVHD